ncbi:hypothetical protein [Pedobacter metabolipauper]|uniref:Ankyrin repeat protein n=1 Tax=Pedobacter metabolipauper TaxID=425513 RepID=A0A4R6SWB1_9SPHI|nr:hypothetical protein [Pedobacter metabolipauper]TDQ08412.1 hypothetical protein ATK78_2925 [Pedobacter metabolipauper]
MKKYLIIFLVAFGYIFPTLALMSISSPAHAQEEMSAGVKLQYFAGACNASQVEVLLANNPTFDIYSSGVTNSPVMVAIDRYITANNAGNLKSCTECLITIRTILKDKRYNFKEMPNRDKTDLMFLLAKGRSVTNTTLYISGYNNLLFAMLDELDKKTGFDINYTLPLYLKTLAGNAIGALASGGLKSTFCALITRYPQLKFNLDKRRDDSSYPALLLAVMSNNMEMVNALASNGADFYLRVNSFGIFPAEELARTLGHTSIVTYLNNRRLGNEPAATTANYCAN